MIDFTAHAHFLWHRVKASVFGDEVWDRVMQYILLGSSEESRKSNSRWSEPVVYLDDLAAFKRVCKLFNKLGSDQLFWHRVAKAAYGDMEPVVPPGSRFVKGVKVPHGPVRKPTFPWCEATV